MVILLNVYSKCYPRTRSSRRYYYYYYSFYFRLLFFQRRLDQAGSLIDLPKKNFRHWL